MKKLLLLALCAISLISCKAEKAGEAVIKITPEYKGSTLVVAYAPISKMLTARTEAQMGVKRDTLQIKDGQAVMKLAGEGACRYVVDLGDRMGADFYAEPQDNILMQISSIEPLSYTVEGTALMEGRTQLVNILKPIEAKFYQMQASGASDDELGAVGDEYDKAVVDFIAKNPDSPAVAYAMTELSGQEFLNQYGKMTEAAKKSIMMPFVEASVERMTEQVKKDQLRADLVSGNVDAPAFTLPGLDGKQVSLSDFKGKWVVIDFWGSWCGWCIKGMPALKEAYAKAGGKFEVIGIDCRDTEDAWKAAVKKYDLPWVNVYNGEGQEILAAYGVQGFPTKAIVNPEGKLVDITGGEDPNFYKKLDKYLAE